MVVVPDPAIKGCSPPGLWRTVIRRETCTTLSHCHGCSRSRRWRWPRPVPVRPGRAPTAQLRCATRQRRVLQGHQGDEESAVCDRQHGARRVAGRRANAVRSAPRDAAGRRDAQESRQPRVHDAALTRYSLHLHRVAALRLAPGPKRRGGRKHQCGQRPEPPMRELRCSPSSACQAVRVCDCLGDQVRLRDGARPDSADEAGGQLLQSGRRGPSTPADRIAGGRTKSRGCDARRCPCSAGSPSEMSQSIPFGYAPDHQQPSHRRGCGAQCPPAGPVRRPS